LAGEGAEHEILGRSTHCKIDPEALKVYYYYSSIVLLGVSCCFPVAASRKSSKHIFDGDIDGDTFSLKFVKEDARLDLAKREVRCLKAFDL
jgi:hypothetical protein